MVVVASAPTSLAVLPICSRSRGVNSQAAAGWHLRSRSVKRASILDKFASEVTGRRVRRSEVEVGGQDGERAVGFFGKW
jgi:hypothetical protein